MKFIKHYITIPLFIVLAFFTKSVIAVTAISQYPLFLTNGVPPIVMLTMGKDHKLYYEAYNDASDLNGDGELDIRYKPSQIDYFGYFDSNKCYSYASDLFSPVSVTSNKQCASGWSGDFLNYITTSRMDALRKVLYGGYRSTDSSSSTILKRSFIPQDAHSWGKEYTSIAIDGYDIRHYTPLALPINDTRHLFANVSLSSSGQPLMRVLNDTIYRIWEWVSIERPVAGTKCLHGGNGPNCSNVSGSNWSIVPDTVLSNLVRSTYDLLASPGHPGHPGHPDNHSDYNDIVNDYAITGRLDGTGSMTIIEGSDNPFGDNDNYLTVIKGKITVATSGIYTFSVDGDDAVEVIINGTVVAGYYGGHGKCNCNNHSGTITLTANTDYDIEYRHEEAGGGDSFVFRWKKTVPSSSINDYSVNVKACVATLLETNCQVYSDGTNVTYKPVGILQRYGEADLMAFGLLTGSYRNNTSGGVLRKNIASFKDEVDLDTGIFTSVEGIVDTIDKFRIASFDYSNHLYADGFIKTRPINEGEAPEWGNPIAEMMYEGLRYFSGKENPTTLFSQNVSGSTYEAALDLALPSWQDPYRTTSGGYASCAKPIQMVISDINSSYDSDQLPGSYFEIFHNINGDFFTGDLAGLNVSTLADTIWAGESEASSVFIGQSATVSDGTPSAKAATTFASLRGLAPEEPSKQGSYYAASIALYGQNTDIHTVTGDQNVDTIAVALASPLPRIEIPVSGKIVTLVPFAKSVGGGGSNGISASPGDFQPTNQIVDFYIEVIANTNTNNNNSSINSGRPYGKFRINYEDVEQAADHDMDAIVEYEFEVTAGNQIIIKLNSSYAAGGIIQHMGYVISGTTADGTYLEVRDFDTNESNDPDYFLDTPPGQLPGGVWADSIALPLITTRTFTVGSATAARFIKHDPLWYAAKWSMVDTNGNGTLDVDEWDADGNGDPDGYFLVTNAGTLEQQLNKAFAEIVSRTSSAAAAATNSTRLDANSKVYQARFNSNDWSGQLLAFDLNNTTGAIAAQQWDAATLIPAASSRKIYSYNPLSTNTKGIEFKFTNNSVNLNTAQKLLLNKDATGNVDSLAESRVNYIRGDQSQQQTSGPFRARSSLMGDIINSDPWFAGTIEDLGYASLPDTDGGTDYIAYRNTKLNRIPALYFGANDGMLHAINSNSGAELFTYIPDSLIGSLTKLSSPLYGCSRSGCIPHAYFVDGAPRAGDAYIDLGDGDKWHNVLVGTLGAGGKGFFALDITDPATFSTSNVMWEISTNQSPKASDLTTFQNDLGFTLPQASIVRMHNGKWAAIIANGYESVNHKAVLFIIDIETGEIITTIDTEIGSSSSPNGLSTPLAIDEDGDRIVDTIYAGDLLGNMWKFDVSGTNSNQWNISFTGGSPPKPAPLYLAKSANGTAQPITAKPQAGSHPDGGIMVYFGTGKYFQTNDQIVDSKIQSFYAIRDQAVSVASRSDLQQQSILHEATLTALALDVRVTSNTTVSYPTKKGWYMDLISPENGVEGERVVSAALLRGSRVIFTTLIPETDPCSWGGSSWLMELDAINGRRLKTSPFDINKDGKFDAADLLSTYDTNGDGTIDSDDLVEVSGIRIHDLGIVKAPSIITSGDGNELKYLSGSSGNLIDMKESSGDPTGRQSWRQLR